MEEVEKVLSAIWSILGHEFMLVPAWFFLVLSVAAFALGYFGRGLKKGKDTSQSDLERTIGKGLETTADHDFSWADLCKAFQNMISQMKDESFAPDLIFALPQGTRTAASIQAHYPNAVLYELELGKTPGGHPKIVDFRLPKSATLARESRLAPNDTIKLKVLLISEMDQVGAGNWACTKFVGELEKELSELGFAFAPIKVAALYQPYRVTHYSGRWPSKTPNYGPLTGGIDFVGLMSKSKFTLDVPWP